MQIQAQCELTQLLTHIISESSNGCTDARSTYEYFERLQATDKRIEGLELSEVVAIASILNFAAIRENAAELKVVIETTS